MKLFRLKFIDVDMVISDKVYEFAEATLADLKERFEGIDRLAEINQMKVKT